MEELGLIDKLLHVSTHRLSDAPLSESNFSNHLLESLIMASKKITDPLTETVFGEHHSCHACLKTLILTETCMFSSLYHIKKVGKTCPSKSAESLAVAPA